MVGRRCHEGRVSPEVGRDERVPEPRAGRRAGSWEAAAPTPPVEPAPGGPAGRRPDGDPAAPADPAGAAHRAAGPAAPPRPTGLRWRPTTCTRPGLPGPRQPRRRRPRSRPRHLGRTGRPGLGAVGTSARRGPRRMGWRCGWWTTADDLAAVPLRLLPDPTADLGEAGQPQGPGGGHRLPGRRGGPPAGCHHRARHLADRHHAAASAQARRAGGRRTGRAEAAPSPSAPATAVNGSSSGSMARPGSSA